MYDEEVKGLEVQIPCAHAGDDQRLEQDRSPKVILEHGVGSGYGAGLGCWLRLSVEPGSRCRTGLRVQGPSSGYGAKHEM